jgi:hypothetical protein
MPKLTRMTLHFHSDPEDDTGAQAVAIASNRVDLDHGFLIGRGPS